MPQPRKFRVGDHARIAPPRLRGYYARGTRVGRIVTIKQIRAAHAGGKCYYRVGNNGKAEPHWFRSDDLRPLEAPDLRGQPITPFPV